MAEGVTTVYSGGQLVYRRDAIDVDRNFAFPIHAAAAGTVWIDSGSGEMRVCTEAGKWVVCAAEQKTVEAAGVWRGDCLLEVTVVPGTWREPGPGEGVSVAHGGSGSWNGSAWVCGVCGCESADRELFEELGCG